MSDSAPPGEGMSTSSGPEPVRPAAAPRRASWRVKLLALAISLLVCVVIAEVALRIYNPIPLPLRGKQIVLPASKRFVFDNPAPGSKLDARIVRTANSLGFRGAEPPAAGKQSLRIITVGGSTTMCQFLSDEHTWPALLETRLHDALEKPVWVNNAGLDGHSTFGHLRLLDQAVLDLQPDYIVFLVGINDVGRDDLSDFDGEIDPANQSLRDRIVGASELLSTVQVLYRSWRAFELGVGHDLELDLKTCPVGKVDAAEIAAAVAEHRAKYLPGYAQRVRKLIEVTRGRGIKPVLMTQPVLYGDAVDPATGVALGPLLHGGQTAAMRWAVLEAYNDVTRTIAAEEKTPLVDLAKEMPKDSGLYYDWMHYTNAGAEQIARIVAGHLARVVRAAR